ncbi:MAG TPA: GGDEF domain-containing protein [Candidatus Limiplasma sp.]|nr:GGDEF domain-containing protein [Candidatus Limiplasma sp.]HPS81244.1 GGDEF domain-containing protein [Candidatus Limiplasma sp.]
MIRTYTTEGIAQTLTTLRTIFDLVRVVDPVRAANEPLAESVSAGQSDDDFNCYSVWNRRRERCLNCISLRALQEGERQTKYEFVNNDIFYVIAMPITLEGRSLVLEIVNKVNDRVLLSAYGNNEFVSRITAFNAQLHLDTATGLFNKPYFDEKLFLLCNKAILNKTDVAVAMMDVDGLERVAGHFGYQVADEAVIAIGRLLTANISRRRGDFVVRYGTNTFAIVMDNIPRLLLRARMVELVQRVSTLRLQGYEDVRLNVAMGVFLLSENRDVNISDIAQIIARRVEIAQAAGLNRIAFSDA